MHGNRSKLSDLIWAFTMAALAGLPSIASAQTIDFGRQVEPLLAEKCYVCHGPVQQKGGLRLDRKDSRSKAAVIGSNGQSELLRRITSQDASVRMPPWPPSLSLSPKEIETLKTWISEGATGEDAPPLDPQLADVFAIVDKSDVPRLRAVLQDRRLHNARDAGGATLLMHAAVNAGLDCVKLLLDSGVDPNARNREGASALIWAADDPAKVRMLLAAGADVNVKTNHGSTALLAASLQLGSNAVVEQLLAKGADANPSDTDGWTPLSRAASAGDVKTLKLLLAKGADPNAPSVSLSALTAAVWYGNINAVRLLLANGARVDAPDGFGFTALSFASLWDRKEIAAALIEAGAGVNLAIAKSPAMQRIPGTPLMLAAYAEARDPALVKMLISHGADVKYMTSDGQTALGRARTKGDTAVASALLEKGATEPLAARTETAPRNTDPPDMRTAVERSLAVLQRSDQAFFNRSGCKSCHNQSLPAMALGMARARGLRFNQEVAKQQSDTVLVALDSQREKMLQLMDDEGPPLSGGYALAGLAAQGYAPDSTTSAFVRNIAARQLANGNWHPAGARPPIEYSDVSVTAFAIRAMRFYGVGRAAAGYEARIEKARSWLASLRPRYTEENVFQLLGLNWAKSNDGLLKKLTHTLLAEQKMDGGWAQLSTLQSDAYATGQVLYALYHAGNVATTDPSFQRGLRFLRETQLEDGSWLVESHVIPIQPYFDAGFPHDKDQFISAAATSWAAMALMTAEPVLVK